MSAMRIHRWASQKSFVSYRQLDAVELEFLIFSIWARLSNKNMCLFTSILRHRCYLVFGYNFNDTVRYTWEYTPAMLEHTISIDHHSTQERKHSEIDVFFVPDQSQLLFSWTKYFPYQNIIVILSISIVLRKGKNRLSDLIGLTWCNGKFFNMSFPKYTQEEHAISIHNSR